MKVRGWLIAAALAVVGLAGAWWFGSPWWTLYQMKTAAEARDLKALAAHVDLPAVRDDVGAQLRERLNLRGGPAESLLAGALTRGVAAAVVSAEALGTVFSKDARERLGVRAKEMEMRRDGLDQFRMVDPKDGGGELVFRRHGLGWKLSGVRLPARFEPGWLGNGERPGR
jgi:hypothetical protein